MLFPCLQVESISRDQAGIQIRKFSYGAPAALTRAGLRARQRQALTADNPIRWTSRASEPGRRAQASRESCVTLRRSCCTGYLRAMATSGDPELGDEPMAKFKAGRLPATLQER